MKKTLLLCAFALSSLMASAGDGLTAVGANIILLPSSYWDSDMEWQAWTWVYNSGIDYGDPYNEQNPNYNNVLGEPYQDSEGRQWYEPGFNIQEEKYNEYGELADMNYDTYEPIVWEMQSAPFSSDETFNGRSTYRWTTFNIMADIYVIRTFRTDLLLSGPVYLACGHDDAPCEFYINGELVFERTGFEGERYDDDGTVHYNQGWNNAEYVQLTDEQKALIKLNGEENVIAFHVHQNWGGAFADCGLYTKIEGGIDMGYITPWEGKVLFNNTGGYNRDLQSPSNNPYHPWSALYEAQPGDEYTFTMEGSSPEDELWREQLHFKTPIKIEEGHNYRFQTRLMADKPFKCVTVKLTDNDNDDIELAWEDYVEIMAPEEEQTDYEGTLVEIEFPGQDVNNFKVVFDFGGGEPGATVTIKDMSLIDEDPDDENLDEKELWIGTHYFNFFHMEKAITKYWIFDWDLNDGNGDYREATQEEIDNELYEYFETNFEELKAPEVYGRKETLAWTQVDFDDSMWDDQMMPTGSEGYMPEQQSIWPSGNLEATGYSSNYWIRRNFELDKINERLSYELSVCHDDVYETYVNGILLQKNVGWTNGKNPVQVHIPAKYLNVGKNVIATYIQQNWGGYFYDCGINVTEVDYNESLKQFNDVLAYAETDTLLTNKMKADVQALIDEAKQYFNENKNDAVELRSYARELRPRINDIFRYSDDVKTLKNTYDICRKMEDKGYWGTALEDAIVALDTCSVPSQWSGTLAKLREARKTTVMERHTEKFVGSVPEAVEPEEAGDWEDKCPKYYLYNVGAKNFLGGGEAYGTHLVVEYVSTPMMLIKAREDIYDEEGYIIDQVEIPGAYFIETFRPNGDRSVMDFLGWNGFIDIPMNDKWEIIPVEGKTNVYNIAQYGQTFGAADTTCYNGTIFEPGGKKYLGWRNGDNRYEPSRYLVDTDMHSPELESNQWMFVTREEMLSLVATASEENPVDLSFLLKNPGNDSRFSTWWPGYVFNSSADDLWINFNCGPLNYVFESYNTDEFNSYQTIMPKENELALPAGTYVLKVQGYYRDGIEKDHIKKVINGQPTSQRAVMYAGPSEDIFECQSMPIMPIHIEANTYPGVGVTEGGMQMPGTAPGQPSATLQAGDDYFPCGLYWNELVFTIDDSFDFPDEEDNTKMRRRLCIGMDKQYDEETTPNDWAVWDNWRLKYYGGAEIDPDAIRGIESDEINKTPKADKHIYNMLGQRMSKTQKGINIINGRKVIKK